MSTQVLYVRRSGVRGSKSRECGTRKTNIVGVFDGWKSIYHRSLGTRVSLFGIFGYPIGLGANRSRFPSDDSATDWPGKCVTRTRGEVYYFVCELWSIPHGGIFIKSKLGIRYQRQNI